jgi:hypothetical protein
MNKTRYIEVRDKIATLLPGQKDIVCDNEDYVAHFTFDEEWSGKDKTARFIWNGEFEDVPIEGDECPIPSISDADTVKVGVYAGELKTTTEALLGCRRSIRSGQAKPSVGNDGRYANEAKASADRAEAAADRAEDAADRAEEAADRDFAPLVDGKVPAENIPTAAFDIIRGSFNSSGIDFYPNGEHQEELTDWGSVVPRKGVLYCDMDAPNAVEPFIGAICIWRGNGFERIATVAEFESALQSMKQSIDLKIEDVEQAVDALGGRIDSLREEINGVEEELQMINEGGVE